MSAGVVDTGGLAEYAKAHDLRFAAGGALVATLDGHVTGESELTPLATDAAHLADAIREESLEEVDAGQGAASAAKAKQDPRQVLIRALLPLVELDGPPACARTGAPAPIDPRAFAATHAKAGLRSAPEKVFVGGIGTVDGALAIKGDGLKRGDWIALIAGPAGPERDRRLHRLRTWPVGERPRHLQRAPRRGAQRATLTTSA